MNNCLGCFPKEHTLINDIRYVPVAQMPIKIPA
jgi:hypothetical protein